jgi:indole-3-glycerol phosphate synthase
MNKQIFIAEIKTQSPYGFKSEYSFHKLMECAVTNGDWVSVHTNALWGGDYEALSFVRRNTCKPIVAKGLHATDDDIKRSLDHGADYVLVVDRLPYPRIISPNKCLLEMGNENLFEGNLKFIPSLKSEKFVYNCRNLKTGLMKTENLLEKYINTGVWICQASGIKTREDIHPRAGAFIVGENLVNFCKEKND